MSSVETIRDKNRRPIKYRARYRTPDGGSRSKTFTKKADAENFLSGTEVAKATGVFVDPKAGRVLLKDYATVWLEHQGVSWRASTAATIKSHVDARIVPKLGKYQLGSVTRSQVKAWVAALMSAGLAPSTVGAVLNTLRSLYRSAIDDGLVAMDPTRGIKAPEKADERVDPARVAEVDRLVPLIAGGMPDRLQTAVVLMAATGLRLGECLGLTVDRVDFLRRTMRIDRQAVTSNGPVRFGPPKTAKGVRTIPLPSEVVELLAAQVERFGTGDDGALFPAADGRLLRRTMWSHHYRKACTEAKAPEGTRTHDLRHVAASALISAGLSVVVVQSILGHASAAETLGIYSHLWPSDEERARGAIGTHAARYLQAL